jgi:hypothetical protein
MGLEAEPANSVFHAPACLLVQCGIANNPSLAHLLAFQLELGLYQNNHFRAFGKQIHKRG